MDLILTPVEARIVGCLIEKDITTPDYYPLTLNSLVNACNQKSSRDPIMQLSDSEVMNSIFELRQKKIVIEKMTVDSRVPKYEHIILDMFDFSDEELAIICILLLRGPQTPGELKTRTNRLFEFSSPHEVEDALQGLINKENGPFVVKLPRQPGKRDSRYCHCLSGEVEIIEEPSSATPLVNYKGNSEIIKELTDKVSNLEKELQELQEQFNKFKAEFE